MTGVGRRLRVLVVDDEPPARRVLLGLLEAEEDVDVVGSYGDTQSAIRALREEDVDLVFLDIQMPEQSGFEVLRAVSGQVTPWVIFVTAYDQHAIRAFEVGAVDYLLKPFDDDRFATALARARRRIAESSTDDVHRLADALWRQLEGRSRSERPLEEGAAAPRIGVRTGKKIRLVEPSEITWIEAENYHVRIHTRDDVHLLRESLTRLESRLGREHFVRVHRSAIVRKAAVLELRVRDSGHYEVLLSNGVAVRISRSRKVQVMQALGLDPQRDSPPRLDD